MKDDAEKPDATTALAPAQAAELAPPARTLVFASGRSIEIAEGGREEHLRIRSPDGQIVLSLRLTDEGPVLSLSAISLEIAAQKHLALTSETLAIRTSGDASLDVGGSLHERTRGNAIREVGKASIERAREVSVEATPGGVVLKANDDVSITGERVRLNSDDPPMPLTWEEHHARQTKRLAAAAERTHEIGAPGLGPFRIPEP